MKTAFIRVVENQRLYGDTYVTWFDSRELLQGATPGQFLMLRCADVLDAHMPLSGADPWRASGQALANDPLLPRAMSYYRLRQGSNGTEFAILYDVVGRGTAWLARREPGDLVFSWGPLGKGYAVRPASQNLLLIGGGIGIAPLIWLADEGIAKGRNVVLIAGARALAGVFPATLLPPEVELVVTTEDGSLGRQGRATEVVLDYYEWADQVFACGPSPMFAALADVIRSKEGSQRARGRKSVQALTESPMGCGTGICYGCAIIDRAGSPRLVCKEGPRFELREIW